MCKVSDPLKTRVTELEVFLGYPAPENEGLETQKCVIKGAMFVFGGVTNPLIKFDLL